MSDKKSTAFESLYPFLTTSIIKKGKELYNSHNDTKISVSEYEKLLLVESNSFKAVQ